MRNITITFAPILLTTQVSAFLSSPPIHSRGPRNTISHSSENHHVVNAFSFGIRSKKDEVNPIHVLRDVHRPQDSLFSGIAEIGMGFSVGVLYSEYFIILTGCGPPNFGDTLERICYQGVIALAGIALFNRIVTQFSYGLEGTVNDLFGPLQPSTLWQVKVAEYLSAAAVIGAFVALEVQINRGTLMDGLSGIDIDMCRAMRGDM